MAVADNLERLYQRNTGGEHRRELARKYRDVARRDRAATRKQALALFLTNTGRDNTLTTQIRTYRGFVGPPCDLPLTLLPFAIRTFPKERYVLHYSLFQPSFWSD